MMLSPQTLAINRDMLSAYGAKMLLSSAGFYGGITYTQSGNLTYFDSTGTLQTAAVDTMVLDYDPSTLVLRGYPFWEARTNLLLQSADFTTTWTTGGTGAVVTPNTVSAPTGTQIADTVLSVTANVDKIRQTFTASISTNYVLAFFIKNNNATQSFFRFVGSNSGSTNSNVTLNWTGSTLTSLTNGGTTTSAKVSLPNNWYLVYIQFATNGLDSGTSAVELFPELVQANRSVYLFGSDMQAGSFYSPYIPTTTAAVTRAAPSCAITSTAFSSFYNQSEGTIVVQAMPADTSSNQARAFGISDGTTNNFIDVSRFGNSAQIRAQVVNGGVSQFNNITDSWPILTLYKAVHAYKAASFAAALNGGTVVTKSSGTIPTVNKLDIGNLVGGNFWNGWIQSLSYLGVRVPDASVKSLST